MSRPVLALDVFGLLFVGRFERLERSKNGDRVMTQAVIAVPSYDGSWFERSFMYDDVDRDSGAQTEVSRQLGELTAPCFVACRPEFKPTRNGQSTWSKLTAIWQLLEWETGEVSPPDGSSESLSSVGLNGQ